MGAAHSVNWGPGQGYWLQCALQGKLKEMGTLCQTQSLHHHKACRLCFVEHKLRYLRPALCAAACPSSICAFMFPSKWLVLAKNSGASRRTTTTPGVVLASGYLSTFLQRHVVGTEQTSTGQSVALGHFGWAAVASMASGSSVASCPAFEPWPMVSDLGSQAWA
jgi:hypothetical protein